MKLWIDCLSKMLPKHPHLQCLDLSFSVDGLKRCIHGEDDFLERDQRSYNRFMHDVCSWYSATTGHRLQLKALILENLVILPHLADVTKALDLSTLDVMDVGGGRIG